MIDAIHWTRAALRGSIGCVTPSRHVRVEIDLSRIRASAERIRAATGVDLIAVVKADAYGLGAAQVAEAIGDLVSGFFVFDAAEAVQCGLHERSGKPSLALHTTGWTAADCRAHHIRPIVWTTDRAAALKDAHSVLSVDTGQQRFACPPSQIDEVLRAGDIDEAMTHASSPSQLARFLDVTNDRGFRRRHAAGSSLLDDPTAWLDAVRPGLALYRDAVTVTAPLIEARDSTGPIGYSGFQTPRHGVILAGYSNGLRPGPCLVNGQLRRIREVGMQSSFVELGKTDRVGDTVTLLGQELDVATVATSWTVGPHEVLVRLTSAGQRIIES